MSYCRFSEGDVYMYAGARGWICCACRLNPDLEHFADSVMASPQGALEHLFQHRTAGHEVPEYAIQRLNGEIKDAEDNKETAAEEKCPEKG